MIQMAKVLTGFTNTITVTNHKLPSAVGLVQSQTSIYTISYNTVIEQKHPLTMLVLLIYFLYRYNI